MRNVVLLALLVVAGRTQTVVGAWKLNPARSTFSGQTQPKTLVLRVEPRPNGEVVTVDRTEVNGRSTSASIIFYISTEQHGVLRTPDALEARRRGV